MATPVDSLVPKPLWDYFARICAVPHGSGNEKALGEAIVGWVRAKGFEADIDEVGNVVARIPATKGFEDAPIVVLQGHLDMVCEKNTDTEFDFEKDSIKLVRDGDWLTADGTTLGADNGIGVATGLALMDLPEVEHGPLEILMTVDEERGLVGAVNLKSDFVKGRLLFNLDSEEDGVFYVGCAGGRDATIELPLTRADLPAGSSAYLVEVKGLRGGHSGLDIIQNRGNAINLLVRSLRQVIEKVDLAIASLSGGDKHNAIPREATACVAFKSSDLSTVKDLLADELAAYRDEFARAEPDLEISISPIEKHDQILTTESRDKLLNLTLCLPHGVLAMSRDMKGMVETSSNLARVRTEADHYSILTSTRSSIASATDGVTAQIVAAGEAVGAKVKPTEGYPGWKPNMDSMMLASARKIWKEVHQSEARFEVIHAGLECGIIGEKYPGMDMISLGPTIQNPHSPDERINIPSVERFFDFVAAFLTSFAKGN